MQKHILTVECAHNPSGKELELFSADEDDPTLFEAYSLNSNFSVNGIEYTYFAEDIERMRFTKHGFIITQEGIDEFVSFEPLFTKEYVDNKLLESDATSEHWD